MREDEFRRQLLDLARKDAAVNEIPKSELPPRSNARFLSVLVPLGLALGVLALLILLALQWWL